MPPREASPRLPPEEIMGLAGVELAKGPIFLPPDAVALASPRNSICPGPNPSERAINAPLTRLAISLIVGAFGFLDSNPGRCTEPKLLEKLAVDGILATFAAAAAGAGAAAASACAGLIAIFYLSPTFRLCSSR
jgi:hypothetical protein